MNRGAEPLGGPCANPMNSDPVWCCLSTHPSFHPSTHPFIYPSIHPVPWTARRSNQSILKEINPEYSLEGLKLKLQCFAHLMRRADSLEKTLMMGKIEDKGRRGWQRMRWLDSITDSMDMHLS